MSAERPTPRTDAASNKHPSWPATATSFARDLERELADARTAAEKALSDNVLGHHTQELLRKELAEAREKITTLATAAKNIAHAYDPRYFRAGKWAVEALAACQIIATDAGAKKSEPTSMAESWQAFMRAGDAIFAKPKPETFEAHGHTWTRHKPGDPCPVPPNAMVHVMLRRELKGSMRDEVRPAANYEWGDYGGNTWEIIGWRYAEKPLPTAKTKRQYYFRNNACKAPTSGSPNCICWHDEGTGPMADEPPHRVVSWREKPLPPPAVPGVIFITRTAAECGQYADKHLAPAQSSTPADTPKPLQNQGFDMVSPSGFEPETL